MLAYQSKFRWIGGNQSGLDSGDETQTTASVFATDYLAPKVYQRGGRAYVGTANSTVAYSDYITIPIPSTLIGYRQLRLFPISYSKSLNCYVVLNDPGRAFTLATDDTTTTTLALTFGTTENYTLSNIYMYWYFVELGGKIMDLTSKMYLTQSDMSAELAPVFYFPTMQWIHRSQAIAANAASGSIPFAFNVSAAKCIIMTFQLSNHEANSPVGLYSYSYTNRVGGFTSWYFTINGAQVPANKVVDLNAIVNTTTLLSNFQFRSFQHSIEALETAGYVYKCSALINPYFYTLTNATLAVPATPTNGDANGMFFCGITLEPTPVIPNETKRAGTILAATNDINFNYVKTASANAITAHCFVLAYIEIEHRAYEVIRIGGL